MTQSWQAVGLSADLANGVVMPANLGGTDLAVWRSASGRLSAWKDRCPHRGMRLSHGFVRGETLSCIYHGWVYETSGACSRIPAHPDLVPPAAITAELFDCTETGGIVFAAPRGTEAPLPDLTGFSAIRSLALDAPPAKIASVAGGMLDAAGSIIRATMDMDGHTFAILLLVQAVDVRRSRICALAEDGARPIAVSRWLEALRRGSEEQVAA